jgi:AmmeMemoRadiSam system protein B
MPAVAGMFYPAEPALLRKQVSSFMLSAKTKPSCIGAVSPHAGYGYSGLTATFALGSLKPAESFIILGPNHTGLGSEFSLMAEGAWKTPLGNVKIDSGLASELLGRTDISDDSDAHAGEHSIEVQLPIMQMIFKDFSFVPICIMNTGYSDEFMERCISTGEIIADVIAGNKKKGKSVGVVASSDFSHYVDPETIPKREKDIVNAIMSMDVAKFFDALSSTNASVCGFGPIAVLMAYARKLHLKSKDIHNSDSSQSRTGGQNYRNDRAVSYRAIGFE